MATVRDSSNPQSAFDVSERVVLIRGDLGVQHGTIRWIGNLSGHGRVMAGIELDNPVGSGTGQYNGVRFFSTRPYHAALMPVNGLIRADDFEKQRIDLDSIRKDLLADFQEASTNNRTSFWSADPQTPALPANAESSFEVVDERPLTKPWNVFSALNHIGKPKGIQGEMNSCYLDSTLFALFASSASLDKNGYVPAETTMKLRRMIAHCLPEVTGLTREEKDPEEFMNVLLGKVLRMAPDIQLSTGQTEYIYPAMVDDGFPKKAMTTVQEVLEYSLNVAGAKLVSIPDRLIVQLPRFGNKRICKYVVPSPKLKLSNVLCGRPTDHEYMELTSLICIESSHYVSFIRMKHGKSAKWLFFNSMAEREGDDFNGRNVPEIIECHDFFENLLLPKHERYLRGALPIPDDQKLDGHPRNLYLDDPLPEYLERMLQEVYICIYTRNGR